MRDFQIRTETVDGSEGVENFETYEAAKVRYDALCKIISEKEDVEEEDYFLDVEHIELIEVLLQDAF